MATVTMPNAGSACEPHAAPAGRASWCGQLQLRTLSVPVKAYAAIASPPEVPLRQLHAGCGQRIEYRKWCPNHGAVPPENMVKGYPYQPDQYVVRSEAQLAELQPAQPSNRLTKTRRGPTVRGRLPSGGFGQQIPILPC